jgi:hypothetical protein
MSDRVDLVTWQVSQVRSALQLLAAAPEEQIEHLEHLGTLPLLDELALEFDDARPLVRSLIERGKLAPTMEALVGEIEARLCEMASDRNLWSEAALTGTQWQELRSLADGALRLLQSKDAGNDVPKTKD